MKQANVRYCGVMRNTSDRLQAVYPDRENRFPEEDGFDQFSAGDGRSGRG
jgi:hypothetical protein